MFGDEGGAVEDKFTEFGEVFFRAGVAEGDADVAEEAFVFDAFDGGLRKDAAEVFDGEVEEVAQRVGEDFLAGVEGGFAGDLGEAVPGAGVEAIIAAINPVPDGAAEFQGDGALVLDGEIGNAAGCREFPGCGDGLGRTGGDAGGAFSAMIAGGGIGFHLQRGEEFGEKEPGAEFAMDLNSGFAIPSQAGGRGEVTLQDRTGVDVVALGASHVLKGKVEVLEFVLNEIVVVIIPRVARDAVVGAGLLFCGEVVEGKRDNRLAAFQNFAWIAAAFNVSLEPAHIAGVSCFDPFKVGVGMGSAGGD